MFLIPTENLTVPKLASMGGGESLGSSEPSKDIRSFLKNARKN